MINSSSNFKESQFERDQIQPSLNIGMFQNSNPFQPGLLDGSFPQENNQIHQYHNISKIDILLKSGPNDEKDLIRNMDIPKDQQGNIKISHIIELLIQEGFSIQNNLIFYFSQAENVFVFVGKQPLPENTTIPIEDIDLNQKLTLKCKPNNNAIANSPIHQIESKIKHPSQPQSINFKVEPVKQVQETSNQKIEQQIHEMKASMTASQQERTIQQCTTRCSVRQQQKKQGQQSQNSLEENKEPQNLQEDQNQNQGQNQKRTKERTIQDIIEKVSLWRKLYNGVQDREGNLLRYSLEDAAQKVGVSKKSLDDYLLQLRFGKKFGFDFQKHKDDKVGVLRSYVKFEKNKARGSKKGIKMSSKESED